MGDRVLSEIDQRGVATVWLNRPEVNNAYDGALIDQLIETVGRLGREPGLRALLLRGKGRHFQAGADLTFLRRLIEAPPEENRAFSAATVGAMRALQEFPRPVVALVHGGCFGGGIGLVTSADIVIATTDATFALTETLWGIVISAPWKFVRRQISGKALAKFSFVTPIGTTTALIPRRSNQGL